MKERKLKKIDFLSIFFRSFFIQAVWNFKGLVAVGLCFCLIPVARRLYNNTEEYRQFLRRHLNFFNTHPYFSSFALGAIARAEEEFTGNNSDEINNFEKFKNALIGPLGAVGDQLFWATIKPASVIIGLMGTVIVPGIEFKLLFLVVFLILYNLPHIYVRLNGLISGYQSGYGIYKLLRIENFKKIKIFYQTLGGTGLGIFAGYYLASALKEEFLSGIVFVITAILAFLIREKNKTFYWPITIPILVSIVIGIIVS
jgi:mannose/fructose/N-acetylgalactosamine-specific phosphotransferase system component IID